LAEWNDIIIESAILAMIIFGAVFVEHWIYRRMQKNEDNSARKKILLLIKEDLTRKMRFINESTKYNDYKPFFTNVWDSVIVSGKQTLLQFELIKNLEHTYSWMKYYNTELKQQGAPNEQTLIELLGEIKKTTEASLEILK
jgi:exopolysaccharide biosynthesis predicted pyruvyltransferase EpsI